MKKFNVIIIIFGIITLSFFFGSPQSAMVAADQEESSPVDTLLVGTTNFGDDLDPQNAMDSFSYDIIHQVSEGLFAYDLGDEYLRIVPRLAAECGTWSDDNLEITLSLREDIMFHNGNPFNADAVKASFDRLNNLIETGVLQTAELYKPLNGELLINKTIIISEYTVKFYLNYEFAPFISLLCLTSSMIVDASVMPTDDIIHTNDILIGTGPYKYLGNDGEKLEFEYYEDYYRGTPAVKKFSFVKYESTSAISTALLDGDVHMGEHNSDFLINFAGSDNLTVEKQKSGSIITYMGMNNVLINKTFRQAINHAINYDYIIQSIYRNLITRMTSVVPPGMTSHEAQDVATYNVSIARQILIDAGLSQGLDEDSEDYEWIALSESDNPIAKYNFTYNFEDGIREDIGIKTQFDLKQIGIKVDLSGVTWIEFMTKLQLYQHELQLYLFEWKPNYNDPWDIINPLFSNTSIYNTAQVNDSYLQRKMIDGLVEFNIDEQQQIYYDIQEYIATNLMPWVFIGNNYDVSVHSNNVTDLQRNVMGYFYVFPLTWYDETAEWDKEVYCNLGSMSFDDFSPFVDPWETQGNLFMGIMIFAILVIGFIILIIYFKKYKY